jgi:hypothetical protein
LSLLLSNFASEYAIKEGPEKPDGTHSLLVYADYVNLLGDGIHTIRPEYILLMVIKEVGLEVKAEKPKTFRCLVIRTQVKIMT